MHKGAAALLWGEPRFLRRGGNPPAPAFPLGETGKGDQIPCCRRLLAHHARAMSSTLSAPVQKSPECRLKNPPSLKVRKIPDSGNRGRARCSGEKMWKKCMRPMNPSGG